MRLPLHHGWGRRFRADIDTRTCSRDLLEWTIRRRLAADNRVRVLDRREVTGLLPDRVETGAAGVLLRPRDRDRAAEVAGDIETLQPELLWLPPRRQPLQTPVAPTPPAPSAIAAISRASRPSAARSSAGWWTVSGQPRPTR